MIVFNVVFICSRFPFAAHQMSRYPLFLSLFGSEDFFVFPNGGFELRRFERYRDLDLDNGDICINRRSYGETLFFWTKKHAFSLHGNVSNVLE